MLKTIPILLIAVFTTSASASIAVNFTPVNNSAAPELAGFVTQDILIRTTNDWSSSGMVLSLTSGSIYQDTSPAAGDTAPDPGQFGVYPSLAFDTYVGTHDDPSSGIAGTARDLGGTSAGWPDHLFDTQALDVTWFDVNNATGPNLHVGISTIGRLSLSDDAQGTLAFSVSEANKQFVQYEFPIVDGQVIPVDNCPGLPGDPGCDIVGLGELDNVLNHWNQQVPPLDNLQGEFDGDGFVGIGDLDSVLSFWNLNTLRFPTDHPYIIPGFVGLANLNIILDAWNQDVPPGDPLADPTGDGFVGQDDLNAVLSAWNAGVPPASVPEPGSMALLVTAWPLLLRRRGV